MNYDEVAESYDRRTKDGYLSGVVEALEGLARRVNVRRVLDLGCGTGRSLVGPARLDPAPGCFGLDLSAGMLAQARVFNPNYRLVRASAPQPPFAPLSFDMVFCVHAFHHFPDKDRVVQAAYELLRPGGAFAIVNFDPRESRDGWFAYRYFEGTCETDLARFPALEDLERMLREAGFEDIDSPVVERVADNSTGASVFESYFLQKDACSQFILLSDAAYEAGLAQMRKAIAEAEAKGEEVEFRTEIKSRMFHGVKPKEEK